MRPAGLHAFRRDRPDLRLIVDLAPPGAENFVAAAYRKNNELQRPRGHAALLSQIREESRHFGERQRGIMYNLPQLGTGGENMGQGPFPLSRVRSRPEALRRRGVQDGFDPAAYPAGRFWLRA